MSKRARWEQGSLFEGTPTEAPSGAGKRGKEETSGRPGRSLTGEPAERQRRAVARRRDAPSAGPRGKAAYLFCVALMWKKSVWRTIEVRGDQTLHDLHGAIQQ